ncbi:MAG: rhodanese-like domain-containing protein [Chloroflexota bacterium]
MARPMTVEQVTRTPVEQAKRKLDEGRTLFVDVRSPEEHRNAHIPGAINVPKTEQPESFFRLPRDREIILY